ncbi:unnamed protein product [Mytilus coruscus]|uniref:Uncharacterized protein n=1 Tax=Mytilus coruscus TaxID=42192 RepID=A0A6J8E802_MYTCO|nr:unnamed protein product [Mytilus coruscus]
MESHKYCPKKKQYADFDVALMYKIIRSLNLVPSQTQGWDYRIPPTSTETTIRDDVERIRRSRNDIVHNVNTSISDVELNNNFSLFIDIASRLETRKQNKLYILQLEDLLKRETITDSSISAISHSVNELRQQSELNFTGLSAKVTTLQTEQEESIAKNIRDQMTKEIEEWKIKDKKCVPTRASTYVSNILNKERSVTLTGSPGVGKTFLARHVALNFQSEGYRIIIVLTPTDIRDYYTPGKQTVFVVDDMCGKGQELDNLNRCGDEGKKKLCSLVLCVLFNNFLEKKWFEGRVTDTQRQALDDIFMACRLNTGTSKTELMDALNGSLVCKGNLTYSTIHDKMFDFLAHYFGGRMIRCLIDHSHSYFINERFKWKKSKNLSTNDFALTLTDESLEWYFRLENDWSKIKVSVVISNSNMNDKSFRNEFITYLMQLEKHSKRNWQIHGILFKKRNGVIQEAIP